MYERERQRSKTKRQKKTTRTESKLKQASENKISRSRRRTKLGNLKNPTRRKTFKAKTVKTGSTRRQGPRRETQGPRREAGEDAEDSQDRLNKVAGASTRRRQSRQAQQGGGDLNEKQRRRGTHGHAKDESSRYDEIHEKQVKERNK